ncbi:hypothetical protein NDU88_007630 [Pleurodeles waltl]|uniref:Uncharacterized protein n=1 Tax=Pleurodeles waltl TaxID=8319 RepID=A0AAV7U096_PLEWA|nr:hypothetical protein NDU88_007630 [Pleurodeles waltl]
MSLTHLPCTDWPIRVAPINLMAFTNTVLTIVANIPGLLGLKVQIPREYGFCQEGHFDTAPQEKGLLCLKAVKLWPEYMVLLATDQTDTMWAYIIFLTPGLNIREITDEQLFSECTRESEIVFTDLVKIRIELRSGAPSPIALLAMGQEQAL